MGGSPNPETSFTLSPSCTSWSSIPHLAHSPSTLQTPSIPNHVLWHTPKKRYTKPRACFFAQGALDAPIPHVHIQPITCHATPQKDIPIHYMVQACHLLNIGALAILLSFATIPAALCYFSIHSIHRLFSPQYGK